MNKTIEKQYWLSPVPTKCEFCNTEIHNKFYDVRIRTIRGTIWGIACPTCFVFKGVGLGLGKGQEYTKKKTGEFMKTGG